MATLEQLQSALVKADAAGDADAARAFAGEIRRMRSPVQGAPEQPPKDEFGAQLKREIYTSAPFALARGAKDIVDTGAEFLAKGYDKLTGADSPTLSTLITGEKKGEGARVSAMNEAGKKDFADNTTGSYVAPVARVVGNALATAPAVSALGAGAGAAGLTRLGNSITSGGMSIGKTTGNRLLDLVTRTAGGAVTGGVSAGLVNPDDAGLGAVLGGALPGVTSAIGAAGRGIGSLLRPDDALRPLAQTAVQKYGIPLAASDMSGNGLTRATRSVLDDTIGVGHRGVKQTAAKQAAFNKAVGGTFGAEADRLTPEVMDAAKKRMGGEFDRIWNQNTLRVDPQLVESLQGLKANAAKLPQGDSNRLTSEIDDLFSKMVPNANGELTIPGDVANRFQSYLGKQVNSAQSFLKDDLGTMRKALIASFNNSIDPADATALTKNRTQYKAFKTVEDMMTGAELGVAGRTAGDVPAGMLPQAVRKSYSDPTGTPLAELSQIGSQFVADRVARTGGSNRAMVQNSLLGGAVSLGAYTNPASLAALPVAAGLNELLSNPRIGRALLADPASKNELMKLLSSPEGKSLLTRMTGASSAQ